MIPILSFHFERFWSTKCFADCHRSAIISSLRARL